MKLKNKDKILLAARRLFNEMGFVNVRLQHISDDTIISVGNIAYHFKNKGAIVAAIFAELEQKQKDVLIEYRHTPIFANMDRIFTSMQELQQAYSFLFTDIIEIQRSHPELFHKIQQFYQYQVFAFEEILRFNIARGALRNDLTPSQIQFTSSFLTQYIYAWKSRSLTWQENTQESQLSSQIWQLFFPYLTPLGHDELKVLLEQKN